MDFIVQRSDALSSRKDEFSVRVSDNSRNLIFKESFVKTISFPNLMICAFALSKAVLVL